MTYTIKITDRDFTTPITHNFKINSVYFSWSAFGGPRGAHFELVGDSLFASLRLLRCPVTVYVSDTTPVWWGFVKEIIIYLGDVQFSISLDDLFNRVKVQYSFLSPDNHLADQSETDWADDLSSENEFGYKELILHRSKIDDDTALKLRDTFLNLAAWPETKFSQALKKGDAHAVIKCAGWFETLDWKYYENFTNFYANYGPGPGAMDFNFDATHLYPSQLFKASEDGALKYAYFQIRKIGSPLRNITARLRSSTGTVLSSSDAVSWKTITEDFAWIKFTFPTPYTLTKNTSYMIGVDAGTPDASHFYSIRTDENLSYKNGVGQFYNGSIWRNIYNVTMPGYGPDLIFRAVCLTDTGSQLQAIATAGNQFFSKIDSLTSGVLTSPYRANGYSCLREAQALMHLGTQNNRLILARVNHLLQLEFYEQPDPKTPTVFLNENNIFYDTYGMPLKPYFPPVGQFASFTGSADLLLPFDRVKTPPAFISQVEYWPTTGGVKIHSSPSQDLR
ncbi:MAG TPA: hypothetical protein DCL08_01740 [Anaerolineaceae bacterium]|nr:hypothetical protein [Anaerolineaceae bacterium]